MSILKDLVELTENVESLNGIHEALKSLVDADGALETSAAASQLVAELAITVAITATVRTAMSSLRLGFSIATQIWKWKSAAY